MVRLAYKLFFVTFAIFFLTSCTSKEPGINEAFQKKYGREIAKMNADRTSPKTLGNQVTNYSAPSLEEIYQQTTDLDSGYYAYVDVSKFGGKSPQNYTPNRENYEQSKVKNPNQLPDDIFEITYNTNPHPPFQRIGAEFDAINIPPYDEHGVKTAMSDKNYLSPGGDALQRGVDTIEAARTADDVEISKILIREQKQLKKERKIEKIFGRNNYVELASLKPVSNEGEETVKKSEKSQAKNEQNQAKSNAVASGFVAKTINN